MKRIILALLLVFLWIGAAGAQFESLLRQETYVARFGTGYGGSPSLIHPYGLTVPGSSSNYPNEVWLANTGGDSIQAYNKFTGAWIRTIATCAAACTGDPSHGSHFSQIVFSPGTGAGGADELYTNSFPDCKVYVYNPATSSATTPVRSFGSCGTSTTAVEFTTLGPYGVLIYDNGDANGSELYVCDESATPARIVVSGLDGTWHRTWNVSGTPSSCEHLAAYNHVIFVAQGGLGVGAYSPAGVLQTSIGASGFIGLDASAALNIWHISVTGGELYISGSGAASNGEVSQLKVYDPATGARKRNIGLFLDAAIENGCGEGIASPCNAPATFNAPGDAYLDGGLLYVSDINNYGGQIWKNPWANVEWITPSAGTGGTISPAIATWVTPGNNQTFTVAASGGYAISHVYVDGTDQGAISTYTFTDVRANHTISVEFVQVASPFCTAGTGSAGADLLCEDMTGSSACYSGDSTNLDCWNTWTPVVAGAGNTLVFNDAAPAGIGCLYDPVGLKDIYIDKGGTSNSYDYLKSLNNNISADNGTVSLAFTWYFGGTTEGTGTAGNTTNETRVFSMTYKDEGFYLFSGRVLNTGSAYYLDTYFENSSLGQTNCGQSPAITTAGWYPIRVTYNWSATTGSVTFEIDPTNSGTFQTICTESGLTVGIGYPPRYLQFGDESAHTSTEQFHFTNVAVSSIGTANSCSR